MKNVPRCTQRHLHCRDTDGSCHFRKVWWKMEDQKQKEKAKKQVPLRLSASLWNELAQWAEDDFRSINGQIEYLLTECVKYRKKKKND